MGKRDLHINKLLSVVLLMVFAIALTPFSAFHDHHQHDEEVHCVKDQKTCSHKFHFRSHTDNCLVCAAHFEKHYTQSASHYVLFIDNKPFFRFFATISGSYAALIGVSLRGPPAV